MRRKALKKLMLCTHFFQCLTTVSQFVLMRFFYIKNNQLNIPFIIYLINIIIFNFSIELTINTIYKCLMEKKKVVPKLGQEVKVKVDIFVSADIKIYYTRKLQDFTARYIEKNT